MNKLAHDPSKKCHREKAFFNSKCTSSIKWVNSSLDKKDGFQSSWVSWTWDCTASSANCKNEMMYKLMYKQSRINYASIYKIKGFNFLPLPLCAFKNAMVAFSTVDLSIFLGEVDTMEHSSLISTLNWSLRFFSERFLDLLLDSSRSSPPSSVVSPSLQQNSNVTVY